MDPVIRLRFRRVRITTLSSKDKRDEVSEDGEDDEARGRTSGVQSFVFPIVGLLPEYHGDRFRDV